MVSVDLVHRGSYVQLSLGERVDRSNPHGFSRREAQSRSAAAKGTLPMVRDPLHLPEHVEDEASPPTPTRHVGAGDGEGFGAYVGEGRLAQAMACSPARKAGSKVEAQDHALVGRYCPGGLWRHAGARRGGDVAACRPPRIPCQVTLGYLDLQATPVRDGPNKVTEY